MANISDNIGAFLKEQGISARALEQSIGCSNGVISRCISKGTDISSQWVSKIIEIYPQINPTWLLLGEGDMLKEQRPKPTATSTAPKLISTGLDAIASLDALTESQKHTPGAIPLVSEKAVGGFSNEHFSISEHDVLAYYVIPKFRHMGVDFMIEIYGDSMIPRLYPGDIIACSIISNPQFIQWNKAHLLATRDQGLIVKRLRRSDKGDCLLAVSDNSEYEPFDIPKDEIVGIARIVGVIHLE